MVVLAAGTLLTELVREALKDALKDALREMIREAAREAAVEAVRAAWTSATRPDPRPAALSVAATLRGSAASRGRVPDSAAEVAVRVGSRLAPTAVPKIARSLLQHAGRVSPERIRARKERGRRVT